MNFEVDLSNFKKNLLRKAQENPQNDLCRNWLKIN